MLAVESDLRAESDGLRLRFAGAGHVLTCRLDGDPANLLRLVRRSRQLLPVLRVLLPVLVRSGLRLDLLVAGRRVASGGSGVKQNAPARLLRLPATRFGN